jgi:hypothetical protein
MAAGAGAAWPSPKNQGIGNTTKKTRAGGARHDHLSPYEVMKIDDDPASTRKALLNLLGMSIDEIGEELTRIIAPELVGMLTGELRNGPS